VKQWFAPRPFETPTCEIDLRPGGIFRTVMRAPDGQEFDGAGCFLEVLPGEKLTWTSALAPGYRPQAGEMPFTATIELQPNGSGGTRYRAVAMHQNPDDCKTHADMGFLEGWGVCLDQLVELVKSR
jgi:uncharacterized protein YndB with AHSA1/START domain